MDNNNPGIFGEDSTTEKENGIKQEADNKKSKIDSKKKGADKDAGLTEEEKRRTAKDVLCFIYLLNGRHLLEHLSNCKNVEQALKTWCTDIKMRSAAI